MSKFKRVLILIALLWPLHAPAADDEGEVATAWLLQVHGAIGPATADYITRNIEAAAEGQADLLVLEIDTPGGLDSAMRDIIQGILASPVPVVSYVAPKGARAASAGTYILYASHVAAMAPATNLGAATPVQIGGPGMPGADKPPAQPEQQKGESKPKATMEDKMVNDAVAYIKSLAELRGRNATWAEEAVRSAASLSAEAALKRGVIDVVAEDREDLYRQLDGREVLTGQHKQVLQTATVNTVLREADWRNRFLQVITDPNIAYLLLIIGFYGLILEFYNPGMGVSGVIGIIALILAAYALQMLPTNWAGLGLILLGIALMVVEAYMPSFGILGIGGVIAFVLGSIILMDTESENFQVALSLIAGLAISSVCIFVFAIDMALKSRRQLVVSGVHTLVGEAGTVVDDFDGEGIVKINGELWQARSSTPLKRGDRVHVSEVNELCLTVHKGDQA